jgi:UDP-N-acetylglucosamine:LPS N-acetylglucosamine transferase
MTGLIPALAFMAGLATAQGQPPAAPEPSKAEAPAVKFSTKTPLTVLMANAQAREVLRKYLPQVVDLLDTGGAAQAPADFNVESLSAIPRANVTPEILKSINEDLAKL